MDHDSDRPGGLVGGERSRARRPGRPRSGRRTRSRAFPVSRFPPANSATNGLDGAAIRSSAVPVCTIRPSTRTAIRSATAAASMKSCVTRIAGSPSSRRSARSSARTRPRVCGSSAAIGSSRSSTSGLRARARARATRWRSPPESSAGFAFASRAMPSRSSRSRRLAAAKATFFSTDRCGKRAYSWST